MNKTSTNQDKELEEYLKKAHKDFQSDFLDELCKVLPVYDDVPYRLSRGVCTDDKEDKE